MVEVEIAGADPAILKRGGPNPGQKKGGFNYMSPFKCIDRPKKGGFQPPRNPPPPSGSAPESNLDRYVNSYKIMRARVTDYTTTEP